MYVSLYTPSGVADDGCRNRHSRFAMVGPVVWSPLATPIYPVKGADDRIHLVYELYITNESHLDYTDYARPRKVLFSAGTANSVPAIQVSSRIVPNGQGSCQDPARCYYDTIDYDYPDSGLPIPARADHNRVGEKPSVEIPNFGRVNDNYYRGAQPKGDAYRQLAALGVKMVVDLHNDATEYAKPSAEQSGLRYINLPLDDKRYPPVDAATRFLEIVTDPANWPVYVHCKGGRHRTGAMTAVYRMTVDDWDIDRAYEEMKEYGFYIRWGHECYKGYVYDYYRAFKPTVRGDIQ